MFSILDIFSNFVIISFVTLKEYFVKKKRILCFPFLQLYGMFDFLWTRL